MGLAVHILRWFLFPRQAILILRPHTSTRTVSESHLAQIHPARATLGSRMTPKPASASAARKAGLPFSFLCCLVPISFYGLRPNPPQPTPLQRPPCRPEIPTASQPLSTADASWPMSCCVSYLCLLFPGRGFLISFSSSFDSPPLYILLHSSSQAPATMPNAPTPGAATSPRVSWSVIFFFTLLLLYRYTPFPYDCTCILLPCCPPCRPPTIRVLDANGAL